MAKKPESLAMGSMTVPGGSAEVTPVEQNASGGDVERDPVAQICDLLYDVALGGSAVTVRATVPRLCPKTREEALTFKAQLERLRMAAEAAEAAAQEAYAAVCGQ